MFKGNKSLMESYPSGIECLSAGRAKSSREEMLIGLLLGEGVGPELIGICCQVIERLNERIATPIALRTGGLIGTEAKLQSGKELSAEVVSFCREIFAKDGAILAGPGGGRFVYESRREFDLYVKMNPLRVYPELAEATRLKFPPNTELDIMVVRDNRQGIYQGKGISNDAGRTVSHCFEHTESGVLRLLEAAAKVAAVRRKQLTVIAKRGGVEEVTQLWFECAERVAPKYGVDLRLLDVDYASYQFIQHPEEFDVVAVPNCFGDIIADLGGVLMGSRGNTYGASFDGNGHGIYQTNHGSAYDLVATDEVNPCGQLFSLALLLRESFGLNDAADCLESAIRSAWREGFVTPDMAYSGGQTVGTKRFAEVVLDSFTGLLEEKIGCENIAPTS